MSPKELREKTNLTQEELAIILGITKQTVSNWETGKTKIKRIYLQTLERLYEQYSQNKHTPR